MSPPHTYVSGMSTENGTAGTEWAELRGIAWIILVWLVALAAAIGMLFVLRVTVF